MVVFGRKGDKQGLVETKAAAGEQQRQVDAGSSSSIQGRRKCSVELWVSRENGLPVK